MCIQFLLPTAHVSVNGAVTPIPLDIQSALKNKLENHILTYECGFMCSQVEGVYKLSTGLRTSTTYNVYTVYTSNHKKDLLSGALLHELCALSRQECIGVVVNNDMLYYS